MSKRYYIPFETILTRRGDSLLAIAAHRGDALQVKYLLNQGLDPNTPNNDGNTPLHFALNHKHLKVADLLIQRGASETVQNKLGECPWELYK